MRTSATGLKKIAVREGTILHVYKDSKGLPTAGVGHLITAAEKAEYPVGRKITQAECDAWLQSDLTKCEDAVNGLGVSLKQNEFDALVSLVFNIGVGAASGKHRGGFLASTVARKLKGGDKKAAADAFLMWDQPPEIRGRRRTEYNQFLTPYQASAAVPAAEPSFVPSATNASNQLPTDGKADTNAALSNAQIEQPPITTEVKTTEVVQTGDKTVASETTATAPKGDPPDAAPTKVSTRGPLAMWLFSGGGMLTIFTGIWGFVQTNGNVIAVAILVLGMLIFALMFRHAITDAIRMTAASDPDKNNVT